MPFESASHAYEVLPVGTRAAKVENLQTIANSCLNAKVIPVLEKQIPHIRLPISRGYRAWFTRTRVAKKEVFSRVPNADEGIIICDAMRRAVRAVEEDGVEENGPSLAVRVIDANEGPVVVIPTYAAYIPVRTRLTMIIIVTIPSRLCQAKHENGLGRQTEIVTGLQEAHDMFVKESYHLCTLQSRNLCGTRELDVVRRLLVGVNSVVCQTYNIFQVVHKGH
ncbi:hypothetical protein FGB62_22g911 [Gracilaria domingensis]|nr:hypothetical protein FGB62_22g911 [Gracilaria domingensis]